jgi:hypothetical protein
MTKYKIVGADSVWHLEEEVNVHLAAGWNLRGEFYIDRTADGTPYGFQAMTLEVEDE